jgi:hypothetical protein
MRQPMRLPISNVHAEFLNNLEVVNRIWFSMEGIVFTKMLNITLIYSFSATFEKTKPHGIQ